MNELLIIKIGGQVIDDAPTLDRFLQELSKVRTPCILVHGGGKMATRLSARMGIEPQLIDVEELAGAEA